MTPPSLRAMLDFIGSTAAWRKDAAQCPSSRCETANAEIDTSLFYMTVL
jgi:hypothetical protein